MLSGRKLFYFLKNNFWFKKKTDDEIQLAVLKIVDWYAFELQCGRDIKNSVELIESEKQSAKRAWDGQSELRDQNYELERNMLELKKAHEDEIIRLKDIIQAKQVQIDKLLGETK